MGFSTQNKQYVPNGCTRKVMSSVFSSMASLGNSGTIGSSGSLMNHIRSWQRSRRLRALSVKNNNHRNTVVNPMNNLCYQSMLPKSSIDFSSECDFDCRRETTQRAACDAVRSAAAPVVSFMNKGEGIIAMQLVNREENQLYSMHLNGSSTDADCSLHAPPELNCYMSLEPPCPHDKQIANNGHSLSNETWYYGHISREKAIQVVQNCATGSFVVRNSCTKENCYALTVRVPRPDFNATGVAHYLIVPGQEGGYKIKGFQKEFQTIASLIIHHSIMKEQLPCTLRLNASNIYSAGSASNLQLAFGTCVRDSKTNSHFYTINGLSTRAGNIYNMYGKSCSTPNVTPDMNQDLMVDVDLDPTYSKILDNFRKVMAHCS